MTENNKNNINEDNNKSNINDNISADVSARVSDEYDEFFETDTDNKSEITPGLIKKCLFENEHGDGLLFFYLFKDKFIFNYNLSKKGEWMIFEDHRWKRDVLQKSLTAVSEVAEIYKKEAVRLTELMNEMRKDGKSLDQIKKCEKLRNSCNKRVNKLFSDEGRKKCISFARTLENPLACDGKDFDKDPYLFCCNNGIVNLRTGELRDGKPEDHILKHAPVDYPENIDDIPDWFVKFLKQVTQNRKGKDRDDWVKFLRRLLGSCLLGKRDDRIFVVLGGARGQNGKGTIKETMLRIMGDYAWPIPAELLLKQKFDKNPDAATPVLQTLIGTRFIVASETDDGKQFGGASVKLFSGGDTFSSRDNYGSFGKVTPTHTLFLVTNNNPHHPAEDNAFWLRMVKLSFEWSYVPTPTKKYERKADLKLEEKLKEEDSKIFGWLIRGALLYQDEGLNVPDSIMIESLKYQRDEDDLTDFLLECGKEDEDGKWQAKKAHSAYVEWYHENRNENYDPTLSSFGRKMKTRFQSAKKGVTYYFGIRPIEEGEKRDRDELQERIDERENLDTLDT